ncbi:hypothetical protein ACTMU2_07410 [Cupriavidus basilensis]
MRPTSASQRLHRLAMHLAGAAGMLLAGVVLAHTPAPPAPALVQPADTAPLTALTPGATTRTRPPRIPPRRRNACNCRANRAPWRSTPTGSYRVKAARRVPARCRSWSRCMAAAACWAGAPMPCAWKQAMLSTAPPMLPQHCNRAIANTRSGSPSAATPC